MAWWDGDLQSREADHKNYRRAFASFHCLCSTEWDVYCSFWYAGALFLLWASHVQHKWSECTQFAYCWDTSFTTGYLTHFCPREHRKQITLSHAGLSSGVRLPSGACWSNHLHTNLQQGGYSTRQAQIAALEWPKRELWESPVFRSVDSMRKFLSSREKDAQSS